MGIWIGFCKEDGVPELKKIFNLEQSLPSIPGKKIVETRSFLFLISIV